MRVILLDELIGMERRMRQKKPTRQSRMDDRLGIEGLLTKGREQVRESGAWRAWKA